MKGTSKLIMGATVLMVVILAIVLGLVIYLLADLYLSLLLSRSQSRKRATMAANNAVKNSLEQPNAPSLRTFYSQGVLEAPRKFLFPSVSNEKEMVDLEKQFPQSPNPPPFDPWANVDELSLPSASTSSSRTSLTSDEGEQLMYICNPIYDENEAIRVVSNADNTNTNTPYETPDTSPSRLETIGSWSSSVSDGNMSSPISSPCSSIVMTPPLSPMKRLMVPAESTDSLCLSLRNAGSPSSDSNSNNNEVILSSSSSLSTTSPSW